MRTTYNVVLQLLVKQCIKLSSVSHFLLFSYIHATFLWFSTICNNTVSYCSRLTLGKCKTVEIPLLQIANYVILMPFFDKEYKFVLLHHKVHNVSTFYDFGCTNLSSSSQDIEPK